MANNVIGLFENEAVADRVVEELVTHGFKSGSIKRFRGNSAQLEDELRHEGIPADEASYYVNGLSEGGALVSVRTEESETESAVEIMNRFVGPEGDSAPADTSAGQGSYGESSYQSAQTDTSAYGAADTVASAGGMAVGRAAYESYNQQKRSSWDVPARRDAASGTAAEVEAGSAAPVGPGFPVGREAYAAYQPNRRVAQENQSATSERAAPAGPGFPIGREAYEAYSREKAARAQGGGSSDAWNSDSWSEAGTDTETAQTTGLTVGREAYEAYSREKASRWGQND